MLGQQDNINLEVNEKKQVFLRLYGMLYILIIAVIIGLGIVYLNSITNFSVEKIVLAEETQKHSPTMFARLTGLFDKDVTVECVPHIEFKQRSRSVKAVVRTGDFTAYANILLVSGAGPRWFVEQK